MRQRGVRYALDNIPPNYDRWAELYWKKQLEGDLTDEEEKKLKELEKKRIWRQ